MGTKKKMDKYEVSLNALQWVLSKRLRYSRSWKNVTVLTHDPDEEHRAGSFEIMWVEPKNEDPNQKEDFMSRILPLNIRTLDAEIERQHKKYAEDKNAT